MYSSLIIIIIAVLFLATLTVYKKGIINKEISNKYNQPIERLQVELERTADIIVQKLEERVIELEYLLKEADKSIAILKLQIEETQFKHYKVPQIKNQIASSKNANFSRTLAIAENELTKVIVTPANQAATLQSQCDKNKILSLVVNGYSDIEIARYTGKGISEVKLLRHLHK